MSSYTLSVWTNDERIYDGDAPSATVIGQLQERLDAVKARLDEQFGEGFVVEWNDYDNQGVELTVHYWSEDADEARTIADEAKRLLYGRRLRIYTADEVVGEDK